MGVVALFPLCGTLAVFAGGLTGHLNAVWIVTVLFGTGLFAAVATGYGRRAFSAPEFTNVGDSQSKVAMAALVAFFSFPLVRVITAGTGYFIDDFGYHTVAVASWIQSESFRQFMPQFMSYLPMNAELLSCWFALPYRHDGMVAVASLAWLGLAATAAASLVRRGGGSVSVSLLTATFVVASPPIVWQTRTFSACDLAGSASLLSAIYFVLPVSATYRMGRLLAAGLLAGLAAGTKATFLPVSAMICLYPLFTSRPWRERLRAVGLISVTAALLGSIWYLRNVFATGNPLFPAEIGPFAGPLTKAQQTDIKLVGLLAMVPWTARLWGHMILDYLDWPLPLGFLALAGYGRAVWMEWMPHAPAPAEGQGLRRLLLAAGVTQFILHLFAPFCLGGGYVNGRIEVYSRYVMPWFLFGLVLAAPLLKAQTRSTWLFLALGGTGLLASWPRGGITLFGGIVVALACFVVLHWLPIRAWKPALVVSIVAVWPLLTMLAPRIRSATDLNLRRYVGTNGKSLGDALLALEALPSGTRITRYANHPYLNSPLFGRDWQFEPVFTNGAGIPLLPLHLEFYAHPAKLFFGEANQPVPTSQQFISNLRAARIGAVLVTKFDATNWPVQQRLLEQSNEATAVFADDTSTIWTIR